MQKSKVLLFAGLLLLVGATGWWLFRGGTDSADANTTRKSTAKNKAGTPHFRPYSAKYEPLPADEEKPQPDQDTVELAYPNGSLIRCAAPAVDDGAYKVMGSKLRHLRVDNGSLIGVLTEPSEGDGYLMTPRGHPIAKFQWTDESCQVSPLNPLMLDGMVVDAKGNPVPNAELVGCPGDIMTSNEDGSFQMQILPQQSCFPFAFRQDDDGFAKGKITDVIGGETERVELLSPGASIPADVQRKQLEQGAHMLLMLLEKEYAGESSVTKALKEHPDNPVLREWSDHEVEILNLRYEEIDHLLSGDATEEDWQYIWLFGVGG